MNWMAADDSKEKMSTHEIKPETIVCWSSAPVATEVNNEVVLMSLDTDRCYGLGTTGSEIWRRLREPIRVADLSLQLADEYESAPGQIEADVLNTLQQFADEGLIEVR
jgi:hypothetical protein